MSSNKNQKSLLQRIFGQQLPWQKNTEDPKRGRLLLEALEKRAMLAGDVELLFTDGAFEEIEAVHDGAEVSIHTSLQTNSRAEGEASPDLVQFAKDLSTAGVKYFGTAWCRFCTEQSQLFQDGGEFLPFIEVSNPDRSLNGIGTAENIQSFPTWEFPDGTRATGVQTLETLSLRSGVAIPTSTNPSFVSVGSQIVRMGSPLHLPINAYSPTGEPLTVTVTSADPSLIEASVLQGNRSIRIDLEGYNDMVFELFEQRAETASGRVIQLAQQGFYDGIIFHRVVDNFVIQGGDPTGTGTSGSNLGNFDDDFHPELQHNREGVLSFAKSSDDTNNSQFFITEVPTRYLDFNHSVFGQIVEGSNVREAISETAVNGSSRPLNDVTISTIDVFDDTENGVVLLKPVGNSTGTTSVTVTVSDSNGNSSSETFDVSLQIDTDNSQPFLSDLPDSVTSEANTSAQLQLTSIDIEDDPVTYFAQSLSSAANGTVSVDSASGLVTVTPAAGFTGTITAQVGVAPGSGVIGNGASDSDTQRVSFIFESGTLTAPTSLDLSSGSDSGASSIDNITRTGSLAFLISGVTNGATVNIVDTNTSSVIGTGLASGSTAIITTSNIAALGDGTYKLAAYQTLGGVVSADSPTLDLQYDTTPPSSVIDSASTQANVGRPFETDLINNEEGSGLVYGISSGPSGLSIEASTGVITWTPIASQVGDHDVEITLTDLAGNVRSETLTISVGEAPTAEVELLVTNENGEAINSVAVGESFLLKMNAIDARAFTQPGIYGAYADILFDSNLVEIESGTSIEYSNDFGVLRKGTVRDGEIDELGAVSSSIAASNVAVSHIATLRMRAIAAGTVNFRSDPADETDSEFLMFGIDSQIPASAISYGSTALNIGQSFTANDDSVTILEDSDTTVIDVLENDQVLSGTGSLTVVAVNQPETGGVAALNSGVVSFTPSTDFNGTSTFTYRVSDSEGIQQTATVTVEIDSVNDPPTGVEDDLSVDQDSGNNFLNVLSNDSALPDTGETLRVVGLTPSNTTGKGATISVAPDGVGVFYEPADGFSGSDSFTYTLSDGTAEREVNVNVTVVNPDNPPTASDDSFNITEDDAEAAFDLLANDAPDVDGQSFLIESVSTPDSGGNVRISNDGLELYYQPAANFNGTETFTYLLRDSGGGSATGNVTFEVQSVNDAPPVVDLNLNRNRGGSNQPVLSVNDLPSNPDQNESLTITVESPTTSGGTAVVDPATQTILYTPAEGYVGTDTISYTVSDGSELSSSGTITIEVTDYEPRQIRVTLPKPVSKLRVSGISINGTDLSGNVVDKQVTYESEHANFNDLLPGNYTIRIPAIPFLQNSESPREINVNSASEDGDTIIESGLGRLKAEAVSIRDWLRSTPKKSLIVAVAPGESSLMVSESSQANLDEPDINLNASGSLLTIQHTLSTTNDSGETNNELVQATVDTSDQSLVQPRGESEGLYLYRIALDPLTFTPVLNSENAPEGEAAKGEVTPDAQMLSASSSGEGEEGSALTREPAEDRLVSELLINETTDSSPVTRASTTRVDVFVPTTSRLLNQSDSVILPTDNGELWVSGKVLSDTSETQSVGAPNQPSTVPQIANPSFAPGPSNQLIEQLVAEHELKFSAVDQALSESMERDL